MTVALSISYLSSSLVAVPNRKARILSYAGPLTTSTNLLLHRDIRPQPGNINPSYAFSLHSKGNRKAEFAGDYNARKAREWRGGLLSIGRRRLGLALAYSGPQSCPRNVNNKVPITVRGKVSEVDSCFTVILFLT
jgi:hypothetical protein